MTFADTNCSISLLIRLMTLATPPFIVVHSNAACIQMTGLQSIKLLGNPLFRSLGSNDNISLASCADSSASGHDVDFSVVTDDKKTIQCHMKVTPIVSSVHNVPKVTHYAVDLTAMGDEAANEAPLQAVARQGNQGLATTVVG